MTSEEYLFILDVDSIQAYIFNTNKLKTIIGASWLLDYINAADDGETFKLLRDIRYGFTNNKDPVEIRQHGNFIYSAGGSTKLIFPSMKLARDFEKEITKTYDKYRISVTTHIHPMEGRAAFAEKCLRPAERMVAQKKYDKKVSFNNAASPYFKICELCGKEYAETRRKEAEDKEFVICPVCAHKYDNAKPKLRLFPDNYKFVTNIEEMKLPSGMAAIVVMDGNNMGDKIGKIDSPEGLNKFSARTEFIFKNSFDECLDIFAQEKESGVFKSIRPLIMGGDDICFIMDAEYALKFIRQLTEKIEDMSKASEEDCSLFQGGITLCAGAILVKKNFPFNFARRIAESLLRSAKGASRKKENCSMVDFHLVLSSSGDEIEKTREREYVYNDTDVGALALTRKPYKIKDIKPFMDDVKKLNSVLARNKIKYLRQALRLGKNSSTLEMLKLLRHLDGDEKTSFLQIINRRGWEIGDDGQWNTGLLDMIELTDLIGG